MRYHVFLKNKEYDEGSLDSHLQYVYNYNGTPDSQSSFDNLHDASDEAENRHINNDDCVIYDIDTGEVVAKFD
jgi:hypothetical protein